LPTSFSGTNLNDLRFCFKINLMAKIKDVLSNLERIAPFRYAFPFDKVGLQVGEENATVERAAVSLDRSLGAIEFANENHCRLLVSHHPLIFDPLDSVTDRSHTSRSVLKLAQAGIGFIAAHTNWDSALGGVNDVLAQILDLQSVQCFGMGASVPRFKLVFFAPKDSVAMLVSKLSERGAGVVGSYHHCSYSSEGIGTFFGGPGSHPAVGQPETLESIDEVRVEMILPRGLEKIAERLLRKEHPYEAPVTDIYPLKESVEQPAGRIGRLTDPVTLQGFVKTLDRVLATRSYAWGDPDKVIKKVAVGGGPPHGEWIAAQRAGADVLVTGEVKQHVAVEASESGLCIVASGHYATEHPGAVELANRLRSALPEIHWLTYEPPPGLHGRPFSM
jgi:dinuclear metal center YbgI/SA1388 family protein